MNDKIQSLDIVETIVPDQTWIYHHIPKKIPLVSARESVYIRHNERISDDLVVSVNYSIEDDKVPIKKDVVRVQLEFNVWKFESVENGTKTKITHAFAMDLRGNIPGFVIGKIHSEMG